jgi:amino acid transporter
MAIAESQTEAPHGQLLRILGVGFGVAVAVGGMIGAGILRAPASIAAEVPSAAVILALWVLAAVHVLLEANVVSELGAALPQAGGVYIYAHRAFGDTGGLVVGWTTWMAKLASLAALSVSFATFLALLWPASGSFMPIMAAAVLVAIFGWNVTGLREGRAVQLVTSSIKALALGAFCIVAFVAATPAHMQAPAAVASLAGWTGVIGAYQLILGAYNGWMHPAFFAEENVDPGRNLPRAMGIGILVTAVLYIVVNAALLYALGADGVAKTPLPFTTVLAHAGGAVPAFLFAVGAMISVASSANASMMAAPRVLLALARDGLLPRLLQNVNKGGSPTVAFAMTAAFAIALTLTGSFNFLFGLIATLQIVAIILVVASLFVLRRREPALKRPFKAILYPWLPGLVLVVDLSLLALFLRANWRGGAVAVALWLLCIPFAIVARRAQATPE